MEKQTGGKVFSHVSHPAVDLHIRYGGQVTVLLSAVALSFSPAHPPVSDEDVLMDIVCGASMENKKVTGSMLNSEYEKMITKVKTMFTLLDITSLSLAI